MSKRPEQSSWFPGPQTCPSCSIPVSSCPRQKGKSLLIAFSVSPAYRTFKTDPGCHHFSVSTAISWTDCHRCLLTGFLTSTREPIKTLSQVPVRSELSSGFVSAGGKAGLHSGCTKTRWHGPCRLFFLVISVSLSLSLPSLLLSPCPASCPPPTMPPVLPRTSSRCSWGHCLQFRLTLSGSPSLKSLSNTVAAYMRSSWEHSHWYTAHCLPLEAGVFCHHCTLKTQNKPAPRGNWRNERRWWWFVVYEYKGLGLLNKIKNLMQLFKTLHKEYDRSISMPTLTLDPLFQPVFDDEAVTNI